MKRLILLMALCLASVCGKLYAQDGYLEKHSYADRMFNMYAPIVNNRHTAHLPKNELMIIELTDLRDYSMFNNIDSVLKMLLTDIEFYKDSIAATQHVRIDYVINIGSDQKTLRFKKYNTEGDLYIIQDKELSQLKIDQDTIHIMIKKPNALDRRNRMFLYDYPAQIMFCLNNYADLSKLIQEKKTLRELIDTMAAAIQPKGLDPMASQSTLDYYPNRPYNKIEKTNILAPKQSPFATPKHKRNKLMVDVNLGAGLVRNTLCPVGDLGIRYLRMWGWDGEDASFIRLSATSFYFFDRSASGDFAVNSNWFVNAEIGTTYKNVRPGWTNKPHTVGIGYLFAGNGGYFKNVTMKAFSSFKFSAGSVELQPEIIFTNNFKQIFPGVTVWLF